MKTVNYRISLFFLIFLCSNIGNAQYFLNPSFEGEAGYDRCPAAWEACDEFSSPDIGPVSTFNITKPALDGDTYLVLFLRGDQVDYTKTEDCQTELQTGLFAGKEYRLNLTLSYDENSNFWNSSWGGDVYSNTPAKLHVYGSSESCDKKELLVETSSINNTLWKEYEFTIRPEKNIKYLILEAKHVGSELYWGHVLIDKISLADLEQLLFIPNVFTPNNDDVNDYFYIEGLPKNSTLSVFDRWGNELYSNSNYENNWDGLKTDGSILPSGTYWYALKMPTGKEAKTGYVYLKR